MSQFKVTDEVDELGFDFRPYVDASGVIPEPTNGQLNTFRKTLADLMPLKDGKLDGDKFIERMRETGDEDGSALEATLYDAVAALCGNTPNSEQIRALPYRAQRAFVGWVLGKFLSPEA